jgi:hypothetical protein
MFIPIVSVKNWRGANMATILKPTIAALLLAAACPPGWAFYCGHSLVTEGDYKLQVLQKCGEPDYAESRVEYRTEVLRGSGLGQPGLDIARQVPVQIDEWTYDFGRRRFMQWLRFENGRLSAIKELGYGTLNGRE